MVLGPDRASCPLPWHAEAAYTLLLYDELLEWSDRPLREFLTYPMQTEWQRKEHLHLTIIQNFDRGKVSLRELMHLTSLSSLQQGLHTVEYIRNAQSLFRYLNATPWYFD